MIPIQLRYTCLGASVGAGRPMYSVHHLDGTPLLERCKDPLTDGARQLLKGKKKCPADQTIELVDERGVILVRAGLKWAAEHTVSDSSMSGPKWARYVPFDRKDV